MAVYAGKDVIVTGASQGIGKALSLELAAQRPRLVLAARDEAALAEVAGLCATRGAEEEARLTALRKEILATRDKIDAQAQAFMESKVALLRELLDTPDADLDKTLKARLNELDDLFFEVLTQNLQAAQQSDPQALAQLQKIGDAAMRAIQGTQPPEVRFVNTLLQVEYPNQTKELLERNRQVLAPEFIAWMEGLAGELRQGGRTETSDRLVQVIDQAKEIAGLKVSLK